MSDEERETYTLDEFVLPSRIAGIDYEQRRYVERLQPGDELVLEREPDNEHDAAAVRVLDSEGNSLGYIPRGTNEQVAVALDHADEGLSVRAIVNHLTGGEMGQPAVGANILLFFHSDQDTEMVDSMIGELQGTIRRDGGIWFVRDEDDVWLPTTCEGEENAGAEEKHTLKHVVMGFVSLVVIIGLLLLVVFGVRRPAPEDREAPPPPVRAAALVSLTGLRVCVSAPETR